MPSSTLPPSISVIMAVYNGAEYLTECIDSILQQTFTDFEFIIVDDASSDGTPEILADYAKNDERVIILTHTVNRERCISRNWAIESARANIISIMDADDWAYPERLAKQYFFMKAHPEITVCGTWLKVYETGDLWQYPCGDEEIHAHLLFNACIAHPTVMFKKKLILHMMDGYDISMPLAEDYDLWGRLSIQKGVYFANIPEVLLRYRTYPDRDRSQYKAKERACANKVRLNLLKDLGIELTEENIQVHYMLCGAIQIENFKNVRKCGIWALNLLKANMQFKKYDMVKLTTIVRIRWRETMSYAACANPIVACLFFIVDRKLSKNSKYSFGNSDFFYSAKQTAWMFARGIKRKLHSYSIRLGVSSTNDVHTKMDNKNA